MRLFDVFDIDGNGEIDMKEFTVGLICLVNGSQRDKLKSLFQICDVDASGEIDRDEFYTLLRFLHLELPRARGSLKTSASTQENAAIEALTDEQLHEVRGGGGRRARGGGACDGRESEDRLARSGKANRVGRGVTSDPRRPPPPLGAGRGRREPSALPRQTERRAGGVGARRASPLVAPDGKMRRATAACPF